jgi:NADPH:quinone reductase-like Zn-dependent oxidoreductase
MKAQVIREFGGPEVFEFREWPKPEPNPTEILVKVYASSINPVDYKIRKAGSWAGVKPPAIIGYDAAGVVEKTGIGVKRFKPGDEVFYSSRIEEQGTYAEYHAVDESIVALKPENLSFEEAASLPLAGCTAWDAILFMQIKLGQTVLIHAASGGVGSLAVQMAKTNGAMVIGTTSAANFDFVKSLGVDFAIDYKSEDFVKRVLEITGNKGADAIYDTVGGDTISRSILALKPYGKISSIVNSTADINAAFRKNVTMYFGFMERTTEKIEALRLMAVKGIVKPVIDSVFSLEQLPDAHRKIESGNMKGKVVIKVL